MTEIKENQRTGLPTPSAYDIPSVIIREPLEKPARPRRRWWLRALGVTLSWLVILLASIVIYTFLSLPDISVLKKENPK